MKAIPLRASTKRPVGRSVNEVREANSVKFRESLEMGLLENGKVSTKVPPKEVSAGRTCSMSFSVI